MMIKTIRNRKFLYFYFNFILCKWKYILLKNINDASKNNHIKKITNVYTSKVYNYNNGFDFNHAYKIDGIMIGYDFDFEYVMHNNFNNNDKLFCVVQINGYISLECMHSGYNNEAFVYLNLKSHYNSILYLWWHIIQIISLIILNFISFNFYNILP